MSEASQFRRVVDFVFDNIVDFITISVAAFFLWRWRTHALSEGDLSEFAGSVVAVLGLIAVSGIWDRNRRMRRIEGAVRDTQQVVSQRLAGAVRASSLLGVSANPRDALESATVILLAGITLARTTRDHMHLLGRRLVDGAHLRIMLVDPDNAAALQVLASRSMGTTTPDFWATRLKTVLDVIRVIASTPGSTGTVEVGYLPFVPSFGLLLTDPDQPRGRCQVDIYHHKSAEPNPSFQLSAAEDPQWFAFFSSQSALMWSCCRIEPSVSLGNASLPSS